jgi:hypothetical protein
VGIEEALRYMELTCYRKAEAVIYFGKSRAMANRFGENLIDNLKEGMIYGTAH